MKMRLISILVLLSLIFVLGCNKKSETEKEVFVLATTSMIADAAKNLLPPEIRVVALMGPGIDPHSYKLSYEDFKSLESATVILYNGFELEGKIAQVLKKYASSKPCYAVAEIIPQENLIFPQSSKIPDPHVWFDINLWQLVVAEIATKLQANFPLKEQAIELAHKNYQHKLNALNLHVKNEIKKIPKAKRLLITAHDAFAYFGKAYEIEVRGLQGISTAAEFSLFNLKELQDLIIDRKIKAVFLESSVSPRFIEALREGIQARGYSLEIGGELYSDALGVKGGKADNYIGMFKHNVETIVTALN